MCLTVLLPSLRATRQKFLAPVSSLFGPFQGFPDCEPLLFANFFPKLCKTFDINANFQHFAGAQIHPAENNLLPRFGPLASFSLGEWLTRLMKSGLGPAGGA